MSNRKTASKRDIDHSLDRSLERIMLHHRRALAQSATAMMQMRQQGHRHSMASTMTALQSQMLQDPFNQQERRPTHAPRRIRFSKNTTEITTTHTAPTELAENNDSIRLTIDLPGIYKKDLKVNVERRNVVTVQAVRRTFSVNGQVCIKKQRMSRSFAIDTKVVDISKLDVTLANGVLTIQAPKRKATTAQAAAAATKSALKKSGRPQETKTKLTDNKATALYTTSAGSDDLEDDDDAKTKVSLDSSASDISTSTASAPSVAKGSAAFIPPMDD